MAARREQDTKWRGEKKPAPVMDTSRPRSAQRFNVDDLVTRFFAVGSVFPHLLLSAEAREAALWDKAIESLGRSAGVLEQLAESTGEAIARISARGDRIDRIQKETRTLLNALVASEADA